MSHRWRQRKQLIARASTVEEAGNDQAWSGELDIEYPSPSAPFPGPREFRILDSQNHIVPHPGQGDIEDMIDWEVGGIPGMTKYVGSMGVVEPTNVDAHNYDGSQAVFRRPKDTNYGDVKTADYNSLLSILYQHQESSHYFPNEVSEADLIRAV